MQGSPPFVLDKNCYYAPIGIFTFDEKESIIDFNITAQVLMNTDFQLYRGQPAYELQSQIRQKAKGSFSLKTLTQNSDQNDINILNNIFQKEYKVIIKQGHYFSEKYGRVDIRNNLISHFDIETGDFAGTTIFWELMNIENRLTFFEDLREAWNKNLFWETYAISYDRILPQLPYYKEVVSRHIEAISKPEIHNVLDIGAGTGNVTIPILNTGRHITAIDISRTMLYRLHKKISHNIKNKLTLLEQNAEKLFQWNNETFDCVNILLSLFSMDKPIVALNEAMRVLKPGGLLVITEPKRCFKLNELLEFAEKFMRDKNLFNSLSADWDRVKGINKEFIPHIFIEQVEMYLREANFSIINVQDSHLGNCATVQAVKLSSKIT